METKSLLYGLIGFFIGGLIVAIAATTTNKPVQTNNDDMTSQMVASLEGKAGDDYDKAFIAEMIKHHQGAVDMATLSASRAKHDEIKQLSLAIIAAQEKEISKMKEWQTTWGYLPTSQSHDTSEMGH